MSASREKKDRQTSGAGRFSEKQRREMAEAQQARKKTIVRSVFGAVVAVLVVILLLWNNGVFTRSKAVATVDETKYTVTDLGYYYYQTVSMYQQYGLTVDDTTKQSIREQALTSLHQTAAVAAEAKKDGYEISEDGKAQVDGTIAQLKGYAAQNGTALSVYIHNIFGPYMSEGSLRKCLTRDILASEYAQNHSDSLAYDDAKLQEYYEQNADSLDSFTYSACFINGAPAATTDSDGNAVETTAAEKATAMSVAKAAAEQLLSDAQDGGDFETLAAAAAEKDDNSTFTPETTAVGSALNAAYKDWLCDPARESGELTSIEVADSGYWVVKFENRFLDENSYGTVDVRHILIKAEVAEGATEPTQEALDAAKAKAQDLLDQWNAGDKTADSFGQLAGEHSDDPGSKDNGGLYTGVARNQFFTAFNNWMFDSGRKAGDTTLLENTQSGQQGWHVIYLEKQNQLLWSYTAESALRSDDMNTWQQDLETAHPIESVDAAVALVGE